MPFLSLLRLFPHPLLRSSAGNKERGINIERPARSFGPDFHTGTAEKLDEIKKSPRFEVSQVVTDS